MRLQAERVFLDTVSGWGNSCLELTGSKWVGGLLYLDRNLQLGQQHLMIIQLAKESLGLCTCTSKKLAVETKQLQRRSHPPTPTAQRQPCRQMDKAEPPRGQRPKAKGLGGVPPRQQLPEGWSRKALPAGKAGLCPSCPPAGFDPCCSPYSQYFPFLLLTTGVYHGYSPPTSAILLHVNADNFFFLITRPWGTTSECDGDDLTSSRDAELWVRCNHWMRLWGHLLCIGKGMSLGRCAWIFGEPKGQTRAETDSCIPTLLFSFNIRILTLKLDRLPLDVFELRNE